MSVVCLAIQRREQITSLFDFKAGDREHAKYEYLCGCCLGDSKDGRLPSYYPIAFQALTRDSYVENTFLISPDHETINAAIAEVKLVAKRGGFKYKE